MGGRLDLGPPTPFPFQFLVLLPPLPLPWASPLIPLQSGSLENQEVEEAQGRGSQGCSPYPRDGRLGGRQVAQSWLRLGVPGKLELGGASLGPGQEGPHNLKPR